MGGRLKREGICVSLWLIQTSLVAQMVKCQPTMRKTRVQSLGWEDPLEKGMATHSSTLAWKIPQMEEHSRLYSPWGCRESDTTERLHFTSSWLIHIVVQQKPTQHCKAIFLKLKNKKNFQTHRRFERIECEHPNILHLHFTSC